MRVLMLTSEFPPRIGGIATHVAGLAQALRELNASVTVVAPASPAPTGGEDQVIRYSPFIRAQPMADWALGRWCRALVDAQPFDLLHVHGLRPLRAALTTGLPVLFTNHTSGFLQTVVTGGARLRKLARLIARCDHLLAPSEELVAAARAAGFRGPATYIPNGVDDTRFSPGEATELRQHWGIAPHEIVVVIARRLVAKNGVADAARALGLTSTTVRFVFVGEGPERATIERELAANGGQARALLVGALANDRMPEVYRAADFCLLPSLMEATSIAGLEAMATGRALIGTRVGGIPALIADGVTGLLVAPRDPPAIAAAVNALAHNREQCTRMGHAGRARVMAEFAWQRIAERTLQAYRETLAAREIKIRQA